MKQDDLEKAKKIEKQVERWDMFAKAAPTLFLLVCFALLAWGFDADLVFYIGLGLFAMTAVTWWFWTIFSIRYLVRLLGRTSKKLVEVKDELSDITKDYKEYKETHKDEKRNRS